MPDRSRYKHPFGEKVPQGASGGDAVRCLLVTSRWNREPSHHYGTKGSASNAVRCPEGSITPGVRSERVSVP